MWTYFKKKVWLKYKLFVEENYLCLFKNKTKDIDYWRARIFTRFILYGFPIGILIYIPSVTLSIISDFKAVAIIDTLAISILFLLVFNKKIALKIKKLMLIFCFYLLSVILLLFLGSIGPGLIYLLGTSIFALLVMDARAGYISVLSNLLIYSLLAIGLFFPNPNLRFFVDYSIESWVVIGGNFLLINTLSVISINSLIKGLQKTIFNEKQLQDQLKEEGKKLEIAKDKAIESDKLKSAFLANMSHEIRTPLNAIIGFSNLVHKRESINTLPLYIDIINKSSEQLLNLVNDIIDLSKIESGAITIKHQKILLKDFVSSIVDSMTPVCPTQLRFVHHIPAKDQNKTIITDIQKVTQITTNLINNAFKYTKDGYVEFKASLSENNESIIFIIRDTGIGIATEKQKYIFERFYQENPLERGVGLGLAICNSLVKALRGTVNFESDTNKGTSFFVEIPIQTVDEEFIEVKEEQQPKKVKKVNQQLRILIAEDDESNFFLIKEILSEGNHIINRVTDGYAAISSARNEVFDLILMDVKMPNLDGLESTRLIREFDKDVPIIAVTAYAYDADEEKALKAGCNAYVSKPIDIEVLQDLLQKYSHIS